MKFLSLIIFAGCAMMAQSMLAHAGGIRMGESTAMNVLASNDCACQAISPSAQIVATSDADGATTDSAVAPTCAATPGNTAEVRCSGTASATGKADPAASTGVRKLHNGIHWQSLLPGVMK